MSEYISNGCVGPLWLSSVNHYRWKGGITIHSTGYICAHRPDHHYCYEDGRILYHRIVYESYNKCSLLPWSDVHHIDENPRHNFPNNLQAMMSPDHTRIHKPYDPNISSRMMGNTYRRGLKASDVVRNKMSITHKGINTWSKGRKPSDETRKKMSEAQKMRRMLDRTKLGLLD